MSSRVDDGFNPIKWDCEKQGCWNKRCRPRIEVFADCFPGRINFGDVDGRVERYGAFCELEWKRPNGTLEIGQRITFEAITKASPRNIVFVVTGDPETMEVVEYFTFWNGKAQAPTSSSLQELKDRIRAWADWIEAEHRFKNAS